MKNLSTDLQSAAFNQTQPSFLFIFFNKAVKELFLLLRKIFMSLLLNAIIILNNETAVFNFEQEEIRKKEIEISLKASGVVKILVDNKILVLNLIEKDKDVIRLLNNFFLEKYINFSKLIRKENNAYPILYVIHISILKKNTTIQVTDARGQLKLFCSASFSLKLSGKQKTMQPKVLIDLLKHFLAEAYFLKNKLVALHTKFISKNLLKLIVRKLKKKINIKTINYSNFFPHNGCRPKKIRRQKRKGKSIKTKKLAAYSSKTTWKFLTRRRLRNDTL